MTNISANRETERHNAWTKSAFSSGYYYPTEG